MLLPLTSLAMESPRQHQPDLYTANEIYRYITVVDHADIGPNYIDIIELTRYMCVCVRGGGGVQSLYT